MKARYNEYNWVLNENGEPRQVEGYNHSSLWLRVKGCEKVSVSISKNKVKPILLTEDILLKCGFTKVENFGFHYHAIWFDQVDTKGCVQESQFSLGRNGTQVFVNNNWICQIKHLHQLQNLFQIVTGEELNIQL